ncbi:hypothetical protein T484DRAFT_3629456 [Baffinella frigidus]|nr:hypothetical protein T484DRAFT_3629456 [Cryptophyta sp. CCMP2293]
MPEASTPVPRRRQAFLFASGSCCLVEIEMTLQEDGSVRYDGAHHAIINSNNVYLFTYDFLHQAIEGFLREESALSAFITSQIHTIQRQTARYATSTNTADQLLWQKINSIAEKMRRNDNFQRLFRDAVHDFIHLQRINYDKGFKCLCAASVFDQEDVFVMLYDNACSVHPMHYTYCK